jgi:iron complex outermembrane recepter protein
MIFNLWNAACKAAVFLLFFIAVGVISPVQSASASEIHGKISIKNSKSPIHAASVTIVQLGRSTMTNEEGAYAFQDVPPGSYDVTSHMHAFTGEIRKIEVAEGQSYTVDLELSLSPLQYEVTVTTSGREETVFDAFQSVATVNSLELSEKSAFGLGDIVSNESGVHKRSFGPGSSRPIVRGFDGDRVLVLYDGLSTGTLSSQSGEHAEPIDSINLDRIEIVKGPATLLYGSNALGGVINMITEHHRLHESSHPGVRGAVTTIGGTNNNQAAAHANIEYGYKNWLFWSSGSRQVASDYRSPEERITNSKTRMTSGSVGLGWFAKRPFFNFSYAFNKGRMGIPFAGEFHHHEEEGEENHDHEHEETAAKVDETFTWQNIRFDTGIRGLNSFFEEFKISSSFSRWMHKELENEETATSFDNKLLNFRTTFTQRNHRNWTGTSGFQFFHRDYSAEGEEALSPPTTGDGIAGFTLQEIDLKKIRLQFGGRIDYTRYDPTGMAKRSFAGLSSAAGFHLPLRENMALVANYTHSYRAPAIEELYNYGPHIGNLAFEIGNSNLKREVADGIDISLRHQSPRVNAEANFYYYAIRDFVYLSLTGEIEHGLRVAAFSQADSRFLGGEAQLHLQLHPNLQMNTGLDLVNAKLTNTGNPLPRIPPLRGRFGFDANWRGFSFKPEIVMAAEQRNIYPTETRTFGYTVVNLNASYTLARSHLMHTISVGMFNAGDRLYRNHLSFIKDLAPEMGRAVRFTYSMNFF